MHTIYKMGIFFFACLQIDKSELIIFVLKMSAGLALAFDFQFLHGKCVHSISDKNVAVLRYNSRLVCFAAPGSPPTHGTLSFHLYYVLGKPTAFLQSNRECSSLVFNLLLL